MRPTRVLHLVVAGDVGGAERLLVDLCTQAKSCEHAVLLLPSTEALRTYLRGAGLTLLDYGDEHGLIRETASAYLRRSLGGHTLAWCIAQAKTFAPDLIHQHTLGSHVLGVRLARALSLKTLRTEHHFAYYEDWSARLFTEWAQKRTDCIVTISQFVHDYVTGRFRKNLSRVELIRNGVHVQNFPLHPWVETASAPRFGIACRLEPWKGVAMAIQAVAQIPGCELHIAGQGSQESALKRLAIDIDVRDRVTFHGHVSDVSGFYSSVHCALNTSELEPLGLSVLEAMATGRPVVGFAQGGLIELIDPPRTGRLANARTPESLATEMRRFLATPACEQEAMGRRARRFVEEACDVKTMVLGYEALYASLRAQAAAGR
jgi:L-malate glycosyltransferase